MTRVGRSVAFKKNHDYSRKPNERKKKRPFAFRGNHEDRKNRSSKFHSSAPATQESGLEDVSRNPEPPPLPPPPLLQSLGIRNRSMKDVHSVNRESTIVFLSFSLCVAGRGSREGISFGSRKESSRREFEFHIPVEDIRREGVVRDVQLLQLHP